MQFISRKEFQVLLLTLKNNFSVKPKKQWEKKKIKQLKDIFCFDIL